MKTVAQTLTHVYEIQKSKFICKIFPVFSIDMVDKILRNMQLEYKGATHYCYAYIINADKKCSDDGEPSGTAGLPILHVLENQEMSHILCIVIRYFGGIKLGAGGLVRAYTKSVTETLEQASWATLQEGYEVRLCYPYEKSKLVEYLLKDFTVTDKAYEENVYCTVVLSKIDFEKLETISSKDITIINKKPTILLNPL